LVELRLQIKALPVHAAEMVKALRSIVLPARAERGFVSSHIYQEVDRPEALYYVEEWASPAQMEDQIRSRRFGRLLAVMETAPRKPVLEVRTMSETLGLDYISTLRLGVGPQAKPTSESA
jgi:quinol monooxygenase YgiN